MFNSTHPKVTDDKDHFPIDTVGRGRNALSRVNQYSEAPSWWSGSVKSLQSAVVSAVKKKYPEIKISDEAKKPKKASWVQTLLRFAGMAEDEYGNFISLEDMPDEDFVEWCQILQSAPNKDTYLFRRILDDVKKEADRRRAKESGELEMEEIIPEQIDPFKGVTEGLALQRAK